LRLRGRPGAKRGGERGDEVGLRDVAQNPRHVARLQSVVDVAEGEDRLSHAGGEALVVLVKLGQQPVADLRRRQVQDRAHPVGGRHLEGAGRALVELLGERPADSRHRLRRDPAGQRDRVGHAARPFARHPAKQRCGLLHRQLGQDDSGDLGAFGLQKFGQVVEFGGGDPLPRIGSPAPGGKVAQPPRRRRAEPALQRLERAVDPAGEAEPYLFERLDKFAGHRLERVPVHEAHGGDLFGQLGLHLLWQRGEVDLGSLGDQQAHQDRRLLPPVQRRDAPAARAGRMAGRGRRRRGLAAGAAAGGVGQGGGLDLRQRRRHGRGRSRSNRAQHFRQGLTAR
jgi:hypothetical protein